MDRMDSGYMVNSEEMQGSWIPGGKLEERMREEQESCEKCKTLKVSPTYVNTC